MKDEECGGVFVDYFEGTVPDKSIFRIVTGKKVAEDSYWFRKSSSWSKVYGDGDPGTSSTPKRHKFDKEMRVERIY